MLKLSKSIYVTVYRWNFKNFGLGELPRVKSIFSVSFLLVMLLTSAMLLAETLLTSRIFALNSYTAEVIILIGAVIFLWLSHFIFLNNKWLKKLNFRLAALSRHNLDTWSIVALFNVIAICGFLLFIAG